MSTRKVKVDEVIRKLGAFNKKNEERIRLMQEEGGSNLYREGYNPSTETMGRIVGEFKDEAHAIEAKLEIIFELEPDENPVYDIARDGTEDDPDAIRFSGDPYLY